MYTATFCGNTVKKCICYLPFFRNGINETIDGILFFRTAIRSVICPVPFFWNGINETIDGIPFFQTTIRSVIYPILFFRNGINAIIYAIPIFLEGISALFYPIPVLGKAWKKVSGGMMLFENLRQWLLFQHLETDTVTTAKLRVYVDKQKLAIVYSLSELYKGRYIVEYVADLFLNF